MLAAIAAVGNGMKFLTAATNHNVPQNTLKRRYLEKNEIASGATKYIGGRMVR